jgi:predicted aspartyl protease
VPSIDDMNAVYVWSETVNDEPECLMFTSEGHTMVLKGNIDGVPTKFLLDTGASGTAFIQRQFCIDESIELKPATVGTTVILGDGSEINSTDTSIISVKIGKFVAINSLDIPQPDLEESQLSMLGNYSNESVLVTYLKL